MKIINIKENINYSEADPQGWRVKKLVEAIESKSKDFCSLIGMKIEDIKTDENMVAELIAAITNKGMGYCQVQYSHTNMILLLESINDLWEREQKYLSNGDTNIVKTSFVLDSKFADEMWRHPNKYITAFLIDGDSYSRTVYLQLLSEDEIYNVREVINMQTEMCMLDNTGDYLLLNSFHENSFCRLEKILKYELEFGDTEIPKEIPFQYFGIKSQGDSEKKVAIKVDNDMILFKNIKNKITPEEMCCILYNHFREDFDAFQNKGFKNPYKITSKSWLSDTYYKETLVLNHGIVVDKTKKATIHITCGGYVEFFDTVGEYQTLHIGDFITTIESAIYNGSDNPRAMYDFEYIVKHKEKKYGTKIWKEKHYLLKTLINEDYIIPAIDCLL